MKQHLNTLFVTIQDSYLAKEGEAILVRHERQTKLRVPVHTLGGIVCFGRIGFSPALLGLCGQRGVAVTFLTEQGGFLARADGFTSGNVLLRRQQYRVADDHARSAAIARAMIAAKFANARQVLLRSTRDYPDASAVPELQAAAAALAQSIDALPLATSLDALRGMEGDAARTYFNVFDHLIRSQKETFAFRSRYRRPPLDPINAILSFLYSMLAHDARSACESAGLDPAVGFLHRDRPGRPGLALDLIEELRAFLADRLALSLINRQQLRPNDFHTTESGAVLLTDAGRRTVLVAYQKRKQEELTHPFLNEKVTIGLLVHLQARLLARYLRGDLDAYPPFIWQ
jgi:CRISPR-associated protein Cas1